MILKYSDVTSIYNEIWGHTSWWYW